MKKIVFRVDSGNHVGIGHVSRSLTLAEELSKNNYQISFITKNHSGYGHDMIAEKFKVFVIEGGVNRALEASERNDYKAWAGSTPEDDLKRTNKCLEEIKDVDLLILDSYSLDAAYEKELATKKVMVIDDLFNRKHFCDLILNQNITATDDSYKTLSEKSGTKFLMGPKYALLREEFKTLRLEVDQSKFTRETKKIMVFFGGKDVGGDTLKLVQSLDVDNYEKYNFHFLMDNAHKDYPAVMNILKNKPNVVVSGLSGDFAHQMKEADLFIGAGGATAWERSALGVASAIICIADNQLDNCLGLSKTENAFYLGQSLEMDSKKWNNFFSETVPDIKLWSRIRTNSFKLVDTLGSMRVSDSIRQLLND